jgi:hypothetical protein
MHAIEITMAAMSLFAAYAGSFAGDYLLDRFGR